MFKIEVCNGKANVYTPYNKDFVSLIKQIGGRRWDGEKQCWTVPEDEIDTVRAYMMQVYGETDIDSGEKVTVRVKFLEYTSRRCDSVQIFGKTVARAWGRDSGAQVGDDVTLLEGEIDSGGSRANWCTYIDEGSVFRIRNVPRAILQQKQPYKIEVTVEGSKVDRTALEAEKKRLMTRIAEIDALLAECETVCDQSQEIGTQSGYEHVEPKRRAMPQEVKDFKKGLTDEYTITPPALNADDIDNAVPENLRNDT